MCTKRVEGRANSNFVLTNLILSKTGMFTVEDIVEDTHGYAIEVNEKLIQNAIIRLRENDYLKERGSYYEAIEQEKSIRWGWN